MMPLIPDKLREKRFCKIYGNYKKGKHPKHCEYAYDEKDVEKVVAAAVKELREKAYCWHNGCSYWAEKARPECFECHLQDVKIDCQELNKVFGSSENKEVKK